MSLPYILTIWNYILFFRHSKLISIFSTILANSRIQIPPVPNIHLPFFEVGFISSYDKNLALLSKISFSLQRHGGHGEYIFYLAGRCPPNKKPSILSKHRSYPGSERLAASVSRFPKG